MNTIYIDMDGVVADWNSYIHSVLGYHTETYQRYSDQEWQLIVTEHQRLYRNLPLAPGAQELVTGIEHLAITHGYGYKFLTAVPNRNDMPHAFQDKIHWVEKHFPGIDVWFGPYSRDKQRRARAGDVLIDDRPSNITEWQEAGGHGILYVTGEHAAALNNLQEFLALSNQRNERKHL